MDELMAHASAKKGLSTPESLKPPLSLKQIATHSDLGILGCRAPSANSVYTVPQ